MGQDGQGLRITAGSFIEIGVIRDRARSRMGTRFRFRQSGCNFNALVPQAGVYLMAYYNSMELASRLLRRSNRLRSNSHY